MTAEIEKLVQQNLKRIEKVFPGKWTFQETVNGIIFENLNKVFTTWITVLFTLDKNDYDFGYEVFFNKDSDYSEYELNAWNYSHKSLTSCIKELKKIKSDFKKYI